MTKGSWGLGADGWSGGVYIEDVLDDRMALVNDSSVCWFLEKCRLLLKVSRGLNWRGDMSSPKKTENTDFFSNDIRPDDVHVVLKHRRMKKYHP